MYYGNWGIDWATTDIDLSGMKNLKSITLTHVKFKSLTLPDNVTTVVIAHSGVFPNLSNLSELSSLSFSKNGANDIWNQSNVVTSLNSKVWCEDERIELTLSGLSEISDLSNILNKFNSTSLTITNCSNVMDLSEVGSMVNLTKLVLQNDSKLFSLTGLGLLTNVGELYINNCAVSDLSELKSMSSLNYIDLKNSVIAGGENLRILADLRKNKASLKIYLAGCKNIVDWSIMEQFGSWWHSNEKAGY